MANTYAATYKRFNGIDWDIYNFATTVAQVDGLQELLNSSSVAVSDDVPENPTTGDLWWNSTSGKLKIYYDDGDSLQWVDATPVGAGSGGSTSYTVTEADVIAHQEALEITESQVSDLDKYTQQEVDTALENKTDRKYVVDVTYTNDLVSSIDYDNGDENTYTYTNSLLNTMSDGTTTYTANYDIDGRFTGWTI